MILIYLYKMELFIFTCVLSLFILYLLIYETFVFTTIIILFMFLFILKIVTINDFLLLFEDVDE
jgi:hypothetical protein